MKHWVIVVLVLLTYACQRPLIVQSHSKETVYKDSLVLVPGGEVSHTMAYDSLALLHIDRWYAHADSVSKAQLRYMMSKTGRLTMQASCPPDTFKVRHTHTIERTNDVHIKEIKYIPWWMYVIMGVLGVLAIKGLLPSLFTRGAHL